ncbi:MAG: cytochrome c3 family protein [Pseudomonadota bacterium]
MFRKAGRFITISALLFISLILLGGGSSAMRIQNEEALNNKCIGCHVEVAKRSMESQHIHRPCFERQCIVCHLAPESDWLRTQEEGGDASAVSTGKPVAEQGNQWRKTMVFASSEGWRTRHAVALSGLPESKAYRFRIVLSNSPKPGVGTEQASKWFGLVPAEMQGSPSTAGEIIEISGSSTGSILSSSIQGIGKSMMVHWQSRAESYGWVEMQEVEGVSLQQLDADPAAKRISGQATGKRGKKESHPLLVTSEYATIDLCYTCHPQSRMGTSHPVRIYSKGSETRIPDSLPTGKNGMLTCVSCHDPHGGKGKALVRGLILTKLCVACHHTFNRTSKSTMF